MINKTFSFLFIISLVFIFFVFYKGLNKPSLYEPKNEIKNIPKFSALTFFEKKQINSENFFEQNEYYLINIWASWCLPCREEHPLLLKLRDNDKLTLIGLNYKDNFESAKKFLNKLGNPYEKILLDEDGTKAIEWGAFGVPETFLIYQNNIVLKFIGPLNEKSVDKIEKIIK